MNVLKFLFTEVKRKNRAQKICYTLTVMKSFQPDKYIVDFKEMPFLMKLFLIAGLYLLVTTFLDFIQMKPIAFDYFSSGFPKDYPLVWYLYNLLFSIFTIVVFFKRSYSVFMKYLYISVAVQVIGGLNSIYFVVNLPSDQRMMVTITYAFIYLITGSFFVYLLKQKKYFNKA